MMINRKFYDISQHTLRVAVESFSSSYRNVTHLVYVCFVISQEMMEKWERECGENFESHQVKTKLVKIHKDMPLFEPRLI